MLVGGRSPQSERKFFFSPLFLYSLEEKNDTWRPAHLWLPQISSHLHAYNTSFKKFTHNIWNWIHFKAEKKNTKKTASYQGPKRKSLPYREGFLEFCAKLILFFFYLYCMHFTSSVSLHPTQDSESKCGEDWVSPAFHSYWNTCAK